MSNYLFDIETVIDPAVEERLKVAFKEERFELKPLYGKYTVKDVEEWAKRKPTEKSCQLMKSQEEGLDKPRSGAIKTLNDEIKRCQSGIPDKWLVAPELQRIVCIGSSDGFDGEVEVDSYDGSDIGSKSHSEWEAEAVNRFYQSLIGKRLFGWNILNFDLPVMMLIAARNNIERTRVYNLSSFKGVESNVVDVMKARDSRNYKGLRASALAVGMPVNIDEMDPLGSGSKVSEAIKTKEGRVSIAKHCMVDITRLQYTCRAYDGLFFS